MYCWNCGAQAEEGAAFCAKCGASLSGQLAVAQQEQPTDKALGLVVPINVSPWAMVSGYLGLFSVLLIFAPFAIITGILGLSDIKANPNRSGKGRAIFGIVMGSLCMIGLLAMIVMGMLANARPH
jgi:hypothetical protein